MSAKTPKLKVDIVNKILILVLFLGGLIVLFFSIYRLKTPVSEEKPQIYSTEPKDLAVFLVGDSSYLYSKDIDGKQHITDYLQNYLQARLNCSLSLSTPSISQFKDSSYRIWGDIYEYDSNGIPVRAIDQDINTIPVFVAAKTFVNSAKNSGKTALVVIGYGANESKDIIDTANTKKTQDKFHNYLNEAKSQLEGLGAKVIFATPVKGCPFSGRNYNPEGQLKNLAENIINWYAGSADVFDAFASHACSDTSACPGPDTCLTRCLINVNPFNSSGFPDRTCLDDYTHPNSDGYTIMAKAIGDAILSQNLCQTDTPTPTPTQGQNIDSKEKMKKGDLNTDGVINSIDWSIMKAHFFNSSSLSDGDLNEDGAINSLDWSIMKSHFWENT